MGRERKGRDTGGVERSQSFASPAASPIAAVVAFVAEPLSEGDASRSVPMTDGGSHGDEDFDEDENDVEENDDLGTASGGDADDGDADHAAPLGFDTVMRVDGWMRKAPQQIEGALKGLPSVRSVSPLLGIVD